jgi:hypothetical protein
MPFLIVESAAMRAFLVQPWSNICSTSSKVWNVVLKKELPEKFALAFDGWSENFLNLQIFKLLSQNFSEKAL